MYWYPMISGIKGETLMCFQMEEIEEMFLEQNESTTDRLASIADRDAGKCICPCDKAAGISPYTDHSTFAARTFGRDNGMHFTIA